MNKKSILILFLIITASTTAAYSSVTSVSAQEQIPSWIKNNAGWWADGLISDSEFLTGIEYLINERMLSIPNVNAVEQNIIDDLWNSISSLQTQISNIQTSSSSQGPVGPQGPKGDKGDTGLKGDSGTSGTSSSNGVEGPKGDKGDTGLKGDKGDTGLKGDKSDTGLKGDKGDTGLKGDKGDTGTPGITPSTDALVNQVIDEMDDQGLVGNPSGSGNTGNAGLSNITIKTSTVTVAAGTYGSVDVYCPSGTVIISGGITNGDKKVQGIIVSNAPLDRNSVPFGWHAAIVAPSNSKVSLSSHALCANISE